MEPRALARPIYDCGANRAEVFKEQIGIFVTFSITDKLIESPTGATKHQICNAPRTECNSDASNRIKLAMTDYTALERQPTDSSTPNTTLAELGGHDTPKNSAPGIGRFESFRYLKPIFSIEEPPAND
jgi:hypothetical protein